MADRCAGAGEKIRADRRTGADECGRAVSCQGATGGIARVRLCRGQNFAFEVRSADGNTDRLPELASELARLPVDVIVATFTPCALAAKQATTTIPVVMVAVADPVGAGLVQSFARPGGNITGFSNMAAETAGKSVELLREMLPSLSRVAVLANPVDPFTKPLLEQVHLAGRNTGIEIAPIAMARGFDELEAAFAAMSQERAEAVVVQGSSFPGQWLIWRLSTVCQAHRCCVNSRKPAA